MKAIWPAVCVCGEPIAAGDVVTLADTEHGRRWCCPSNVHADSRPSDALQSDELALPRVPGTPAVPAERHEDDTEAPRRAA